MKGSFRSQLGELDDAAALRQDRSALRVTREQIIDEIKRTTAEHGGRPLGQARFFDATGIKTSDWHGKYWARWGDALREAGFSGNTLQEAYPENLLIEKFVALTRELGHFPVKGELRLKRKTDPSFPNDKTFGRFGGKAALISKIVSYCRERSGFEDMIELCSHPGSSPQRADQQTSANEPNAGSGGSVYLIKSGHHHKIGHSNSVGRREYELAIQLPERVRLVHRILTDDPAGIEAYWHKRFEQKRANGEWFKLDAADIQAFKRRSFM
jgi:hypothetical protein